MAEAPARKLISVVIPAYNERNNVWRAYETVNKVFTAELAAYDLEIVFTDNHSEDGTIGELAKIAGQDNRVRVARFTRNYGFNKSLLTGYRLARGDAAIQLDCDLQDSPELFPTFVRLWEQGHDVVVGRREQREEVRWLQALRKVFYRTLNRISQDNLVLDGGDFRLVDRHILEQLRNLYDAAPYVRGLVSTLAANQTSFPYQRQARAQDKSKFPFIKLVGLAVEGIVSHSTLPLRIATGLGVLAASGAVILAFFYVISKWLVGAIWPAGLATTVVLQLFGIGLNAILLGIIGEYLGRIYQQLRERPITVIERTYNL